MDYIKTIVLNPNQQYFDAPVIINQFKLLCTNNDTYIEFNIHNASEKAVKSIYLLVECFDDAKDPVADDNTIVINLLDIDIKPKSSYASVEPHKLINNTVRLTRITIVKVVLQDGEVFRYNTDTLFEVNDKITINQIYNTTEIGYLKQVCHAQLSIKSLDLRYIPVNYSDDKWLCCCGYYNGNHPNCNNCGAIKSNVFKLNETDFWKSETLKENERLKELEKERRDEKERERLLKEQEKLEKNRNEKNKKKSKILIAVAICFVAISTFVGYSLYNESNYDKAIQAISNSDFETAKTLLLKKADYKDSNEILKDVEYNLGLIALENKEFDVAINQFMYLSNYKDSSEQLMLANRGKAHELYDNEKYHEAINKFNLITLNEQDELVLSNAFIKLSKESIDNKDYQIAIGYLENQENHNEYQNLINEASYNIAKLIIDGHSDLSLNNLKDIYLALRYVEDTYLDTLELKSDYSIKYQEIIYSEAVELFNKKYFLESRELFNLIPDYADTSDYLESVYFKIEGAYSIKPNGKINVIYTLKPEGAIDYNYIGNVFKHKWNLDDEYQYGIRMSDRYSEILSFSDDVLRVKNLFDRDIDEFYKISDQTDAALITPIEGKPLKRMPAIGMTPEQVRESLWGEPRKINKTTTTYGVSEQWVYYDNKFIYFDDGVVTAIQE